MIDRGYPVDSSSATWLIVPCLGWSLSSVVTVVDSVNVSLQRVGCLLTGFAGLFRTSFSCFRRGLSCGLLVMNREALPYITTTLS